MSKLKTALGVMIFLLLLNDAQWHHIYSFCERVYDHVLAEVGHIEDHDTWVITTPLSEVKDYYTSEINTILAEENIGYQFVNGEFQRRGWAQTQQNIQRVGVVLGGERFRAVRNHFNKARKFFNELPEPDSVNCVKEAILALEACLEVLTGKPASKDCSKVINQLQGNGEKQIPSPIAQGMIKLHSYRGSGKGVAHAALGGNRVSEVDAELVLSLSAAYITYLIDLFLDSK